MPFLWCTIRPLTALKRGINMKRYETYNGWKRAILKAFPTAVFEGDKDIAQAWVGTVWVGEWEGSYGEVGSPFVDVSKLISP